MNVETEMFDIQEELKKLPAKPGVYINYLCRKSNQPEKSCETIFSEQQKQRS